MVAVTAVTVGLVNIDGSSSVMLLEQTVAAKGHDKLYQLQEDDKHGEKGGGHGDGWHASRPRLGF